MKIKNVLSAFSLIELSVVILIIGILVVGISQSSRIIGEAKLKSAISATKSSPVNSIEGLVLWLDASNKENIAVGTAGNGIYGNPSNNDDVTNWKSQNPHSDTQITVNAATGTMPKYLQKGIGGLPSLSFNGTSNYLESLITPMRQGIQQFTYIAVWQIPSTGSHRTVFEQSCNLPSCSEMRASLLADATGNYGFIGHANDYKVVPYPLKKPILTAMIMTSNVSNVKVYTNSLTASHQGATDGVNSNRVISNGIFVVGSNGYTTKSEFFNGYVSEIIIFDRALKDSEVKAIIEYLSRKYSIKLS